MIWIRLTILLGADLPSPQYNYVGFFQYELLGDYNDLLNSTYSNIISVYLTVDILLTIVDQIDAIQILDSLLGFSLFFLSLFFFFIFAFLFFLRPFFFFFLSFSFFFLPFLFFFLPFLFFFLFFFLFKYFLIVLLNFLMAVNFSEDII